MNEELNAMIAPHAPLPLSYKRNQKQFKVDAVGIDAIVHAVVRFHPIAVDIAGIRLLRTEVAINVDFLNAGRPKKLRPRPGDLSTTSDDSAKKRGVSRSGPTSPYDFLVATRRCRGQTPESKAASYPVRDNLQCQHLRCQSQRTVDWAAAVQSDNLIVAN